MGYLNSITIHLSQSTSALSIFYDNSHLIYYKNVKLCKVLDYLKT